MIKRLHEFFKVYENDDLTIKEATFLLFLHMGVLGGLISTFRAILQQQPNVIIANSGVLLLCIILSWFCRKRKNIRLCSFIVLGSLTVIVFPLLYFRSGGIYSAMPLWFIMLLAVSAAVMDNKFKKWMISLQVVYTVGVMIVAEVFPDLVTGVRGRDQLFIAVIIAYILVVLSIVIVETYVIAGFEKNLIELQKAKEETDLVAKAKMDFLANMSHEIRTPINAVKGLNEISLEETDIEKIKENCKDIQTNTELLLGIINDILDFSKIEKGKYNIVEDIYHVSDLIKEIKTLENKAIGKGIDFELNDSNLPDALVGDYVRVTQICVNIINNAIKYTDKGKVCIDLDYVDNTLVLNVKDTGRGIKQEDLPYIFDAFERASEKNNTKIEGTGLGLAITKRLVEQMEGKVAVNSIYGEGTEFTATIPQKIGDYKAKKNTATEIPDFSGKTILCIDDIAINLKVIEGLVGMTKADVVCLDSGISALEWLESNAADVIISDMMMPIMSGEEFLNIMRDRGILTPVIALTADAVDNANTRYREMGFDEYLCKPIDRFKLYEMLNRFIDGV